MINNALPVLLSLVSLFLHPFHVSVIELEYNADEKAMQLSERVFLDDLEESLNENYNVRIDIMKPNDKNLRDSLIKDYIVKNLRITINGKIKSPNYLGHEIEKDAIWCYIEYYGVKKIKQLGVRNTLFFDKFDDQNNLVHVKYLGETTSKRMMKSEPEKSFSFE